MMAIRNNTRGIAMAWKIVGHHNAVDMGKGKTFFGPHPAKVWVREPGKRKARKIAAKNMLTGRGIWDKREQEAKACEYAMWLVKRDHIALPGNADNPAYGKCFWNTCLNAAGKSEQRVASVSFHAKGFAWGHTVQIPNWDFVPRAAIEETVSLDDDFANLCKTGLALLFAATPRVDPVSIAA
jgi:hypothetical protein